MAKFYLFFRSFLVVIFVLGGFSAFAQKTIAGRITSKDDGSPVPGVNVIEKGTTNGATSDANGDYKVVVGDGATLIFSFIGYKTVEVPVGNQTSINLGLESDVTALSEVVVVGYGQQEKKDVTGVVTAVDAKSFNRGAIVSPDQLINGKIAGVQISAVDGTPGSGSNIRIRGGTSLGASNEPLYVIDGFPVDGNGTNAGTNPLNFINPNDIETFTVLKDASAAAIYGSRAANGVIIITTKKGKSGSPTITYDGYGSQSQIAKQYDVFNADQFRNVVSAYAPQNLKYLGVAGAEDPAQRAYNTNWQDQIFRKASGQNHNLTISGGNDKSSYRFSVNSMQLNGIINTSYTKKTTVSMGMSQLFLNDDLKMDVNLKIAQTEDRFAPGVIGNALAMDPTHPVYDAKSPFGGYYENYDSTGGKRVPVQLSTANPVSMLNQTTDIGSVFRGLGNVQFDYKVRQLPGLRFNVNLGADLTRGQRNTFMPSTLRGEVSPDTGRVTVQHPYKHSQLMELYGNYTRDFGAIGKFEVTGGWSYQDFYSENQGFNSTHLSTNVYGVNNPQVARLTIPFNPGVLENKLISFFGRLNYSMKDRYLITANIRQDGSTHFGPGKQRGLFVSGAAGWRIINESFMAGLQDIFTDLKLRVGYGVNGNQGIPDYQFLASYTPGDVNSQYLFGNQYYTTIRPSAYNSNVQWEQTAATNIGMDFGVLNGRLSGSFEVYQKNTSKLLVSTTLSPGSNNSNTDYSNVGKLRNRGIELTLNAVPVVRGDLKWEVSVNAALNKNTIQFLDGNTDPNFQGIATGFISGGVGNTVQTLRVGQAANSFLVYEHKNGPDGKPVADNPDGSTKATDMYVDRNGDGIINEKDKRIYKSPLPKVLMGFTSTLNYKNFDFSFTLRANLGAYNYNNVQAGATFQNAANAFRPVNMVTSVLNTNYYTPQYWSDAYVQNASFLRVDNITIGYSLKKVSTAKIRIYGTVQNAFIITKYSGLDPEQNINTGAGNSPGIDNNVYPRARTFVVGIRVGI